MASLAFSADSALLALGHWDGTLSVCDAVTGRILKTWSGHPNFVSGLACGHKEAVLVSGADDGRVKLWSLRPGGSLLAEYPHQGPVSTVAFSPDDRDVVSISPNMLQVWDRNKKREHFSRTLDAEFLIRGVPWLSRRTARRSPSAVRMADFGSMIYPAPRTAG